MASRSDIKAGRAYVELMLKDGAFTKGLRAAGLQLKNFGGTMMTIGAAMTAAGAAVGAVLLGAVKKFADVGSALNDLSARTGVAVKDLAELGYAAEQTGASMEDLEKGLRTMQKNGFKASQFDAIAAKIGSIQDPTLRTQKALEIFGKSGAKLIPMFSELATLRAEAKEMGLAPSEAAVQRADALGDAFHKLERIVGRVIFEIGDALAPAVQTAMSIIGRLATTIGHWVKANHEIIAAVGTVAAVVTTAGVTLTGFGLAIKTAGFLLSGFATAIGLVKGTIAFLLTPLGIVTAAIGGLATWFLKATGAGEAMGAALKKTFGGLAHAIASGDWGLAGQIAMTGLKTAMLTGVTSIVNTVGGQFGDFMGTLGAQIADGNLIGAWDTTVAGMAKIWADFSEGVVSTFRTAATAIISEWERMVPEVSQNILKKIEQGGIQGPIWKRILGITDDKFAELRELMGLPSKEQDDADVFRAKLASRRADLQKQQLDLDQSLPQTGRLAAASDPEMLAKMEAVAERKRILQEQIDAIDRELADTRTELQKIQDNAKAPKGIKDAANSARAWVKGIQDQATANQKAADANLKPRTQGGAGASRDALDAARAELDALRKRAADLQAERERELQARMPNRAALATDFKGEVFGTFSGAALEARGRGTGGSDNHFERALEKKDRKEEKRHRELLRRIEQGVIV